MHCELHPVQTVFEGNTQKYMTLPWTQCKTNGFSFHQQYNIHFLAN